MNFARVFTGFEEQVQRGNVEKMKGSHNYFDPMKLTAGMRDVYPKPDLDDNYLGDGYPLCGDLPERAFLTEGARYEFVGYNDKPQTLILSETSKLFAALCR